MHKGTKKYPSILLVIALAFVASLLVYEGLGKSDTNEFTPILYKMLDSSYLANDWFVSINADTVGIRSYFIGLLWLTLQTIPHAGIVYFLWYFVTLAILAIAVYLISNHLFRDEKSAVFTSFLVLVGATFQLGGNLMVHSYLASFGLSFALIILSLYFLLTERPFLFALVAGLATLVHFLWGGIGFGVLWAASLLTNVKDKSHIKKHVVTAFVYLPFFLLITPILFGQANAATHLSGEQVAEMLGYIRAPHHYLPFTWSPLQYIEFFLFLSIAVMAFLKTPLEKSRKLFFSLLAGIILLAFGIYTFASEIVPLGLIIKMHFFRLAPLLCLCGYLFIGNYLFNSIQDSASYDKLKALAFMGLTVSLFSNHLILIAWPFFMASFFYGHRIRFTRAMPYVMVVVALGVIGALAFNSTIGSVLAGKSDRITLFLFKVMLFIPLSLYLLVDDKRTRKLFFALLGLSALVFVVAQPHFLYYSYAPETTALYDFIKKSTPADAIFLVPPSEGSFRLGAERAIVVDFKAFPFEEKHMTEWVQRIQAVSNNPPLDKTKTYSDLVEQGYSSLTDRDVRALQEKYHFSYVLFRGDKSLDFPKIYSNEAYTLYEVTNS